MTAAIAVIVPTRNRPRLAIDAVRSLLDQDCEIDIYVSDNSASPDPLREFWDAEPRVTWLRPPEELSMSEHWDWAIRQAMERSAATHFSVHYDRRVSKPDHWGGLAAIASQWPDLLLTFPSDQISHQPPPLRLWQPPWTGKLFSMRTARIAGQIALGRVMDLGHTLPVLSNCVVPRAVLQSIVDRFGDLCRSSGPDSAFLARYLALHDRCLHYDRAQGVYYASHRSNGLGYLRGKGGDFADFMKTFGDRSWLDAAPLPGINLGQNILYHEYELVRRETGERLPRLDRRAVLDDLGRQLRWVADPGQRADLQRLLRARGWEGPEPEAAPLRTWRDALRSRLYGVRLRLHRLRMRWQGKTSPTITGFSFRSDRHALHFALRHPREPQEGAEHLAIVEPLEIPVPGAAPRWPARSG
jgi:hypothetical protein